MENDLNDEKLDRLFGDARKAVHYRKDIEYGFETRVMARIKEEGERRSPFLLWAWRLIPVFASIVVVLGIWIYSTRYSSTADLTTLTRVGNEDTTLVAFLAGE
jgi:hypothetical protein